MKQAQIDELFQNIEQAEELDDISRLTRLLVAVMFRWPK